MAVRVVFSGKASDMPAFFDSFHLEELLWLQPQNGARE